MTEFLTWAALLILATLALSLVRVVRGPAPADRMMAAQLMATGGVAVLLLLAEAQGQPGILDTALVLGLLAAFAAVGFVKTHSRSGAGDPEAED